MSNQSKHIEMDLKELLSIQKFGVLATNQNGHPYCSLVAFISTADLNNLFFATARKTRKYENLQKDERVSMLIDSRTNRKSDFRDAIAATIVGTANEIDKKEHRDAQTLYLAKHPDLKKFITSPSCALFKIDVDTYYVVQQFQKVTELHIRE